MNEDEAVAGLWDAVHAALPDAAREADVRMVEQGFSPPGEYRFLWLEALAEVTNSAIRRRNQRELRHQLRFFAEQFGAGTAALKKCLEAYYLENLLWNLTPEDRAWAWPRIPGNLRKRCPAIRDGR